MSVIITTNKNNPYLRVIFDKVIIQSFGDIQFDIDSNEKLKMPVTATYTKYKPELIV